MFLYNIDSIQKREIIYNDGDDFFIDDDKTYMFDEIDSYYHKIIEHYTNSVYQGRELKFTLVFKNDAKIYSIRIESNHEEKYKLINKLSKAIAKYREDKYIENYNQNKQIIFNIFNSDNQVLLQNKNIFFQTKTKNFEVDKIYFKNKIIEFIGKNDKKKIDINSLSDKEFFLKTTPQIIPFEEKVSLYTKIMNKISPILWKIYFIYIALFGGSFFLHRFCCESIPANGYTEFAGILLMFTLLLMFISEYLVVPAEIEKRKRNMKNG